jgi:Zn-dependent protease with chaperone function
MTAIAPAISARTGHQRPLHATWFDGTDARAHAASLVPHGRHIDVVSAVRVGRYAVETLRPSSPVSGVPLRIGLPDGGTLVLRDHAANDMPFAQAARGQAERIAHRLERNLAFVCLSFVLLVAGGYVAYRDGLPRVARAVATHIPPAAEASLGESILSGLDRLIFTPSRLPDERRTAIARDFERLAAAAGAQDRLVLAFRSTRGARLANAMALPGGTIVVTDALVRILSDDRLVAAVLAHEIGHQVRRHALTRLLESSATALFFGAVVGDLSGVGSIAASAPTILLRLEFSRQDEDDADRQAYALLTRIGESPARLGDALEALVTDARCGDDGPRESEQGDEGEPRRARECRDARMRDDSPAYLSTHPDIRSRIENARSAGR